MTASFDPELAYRLHRQAELRDEQFGALAYHFGTRRLSFLKAPILVDVVRALADSASVHAALRRCGVPQAQRPAILQALAGLADSQLIEVHEGARL
ncbi:MAG: mycofactocin biosynthesis chaperone MftB [Geodermatophilaceae bacterium]|nr:mycofactocin biosynthesis chaperone MftB [Geodermatophilaceae bacterium]MDQ3466315.1 mycofactocin biosynthesis chaperone MftB [Actinomycetota bacterium]